MSTRQPPETGASSIDALSSSQNDSLEVDLQLSIDTTLSSAESIYQHHLELAQQLLDKYFAGDDEAIAMMRERHPQGKEDGFVPTLVDARLLVSRDGFQIKTLDLVGLKKSAKVLLRQVKANNSSARHRMEKFHPKWQQDIANFPKGKNIENCQLADTQLVIARENGISSWPKLKHLLDEQAQIKKQIQAQGDHRYKSIFDKDVKTLHLRCGTDIEEGLKAAGLEGVFIEISNPFPQGRVVASDPVEMFAEVRANFIYEAYDGWVEPERTENTEAHFTGEDNFLRSLPRDYRRICLWFEHDIYDQLSFAYICHHLAKLDLSGVQLELVQVNSFPGVKRFIGIGQLDPASLAFLWQKRRPLTVPMIAFAARVWKAFTEETPEQWFQLSVEKHAPLPIMQVALKRLMQELPSLYNGLSLTEQLALKILRRDGRLTAGKVFHFLMAEEEPQAFLGDIMFLYSLSRLWQGPTPLLTMKENAHAQPASRPNHPMAKFELELNELGAAVLNGEEHWLKLSSSERWLGNTVFSPGRKNWYWNGVNPVYMLL